MGHLYKFNLLQNLRKKADIFWPLLFPLILGTLFFITFGKSGSETSWMSAVPVAAVEGENVIFETFLKKMDGDSLEVKWMSDEEAEAALIAGEVDGIYFCTEVPSLSVTSAQMNESILETMLNMYLQNQKLVEEIAAENPLKVVNAVGTMSSYQNYVKNVSAGGREIDNMIVYFFALIAMACLFGAFLGLTAAINLRADQSALASRRSIVPVNRLTMVISEMLAVFTIQFINICILLLFLHFVLGISFGEKWPLLLPVCALGSMTGVSFGIFVGSQRFSEGVKNGIVVCFTLLMSFLAGLMLGNMKDIIEHRLPILNRINPAALISDAFYSISVYDNPVRYRMNLVILALITVLLTVWSFLRLRRERYDSL